MDFLQNPFSLFVVYGTACYVLTFLTRRVVEAARPDLKKQADPNALAPTYKTEAARWWNEAVLYIISPVFGVGLSLGLRHTAYFPEEFKDGVLTAIMAGLCVGFTCGWFFKIFKKLLSRVTGVKELDKISEYPAPPGG